MGWDITEDVNVGWDITAPCLSTAVMSASRTFQFVIFAQGMSDEDGSLVILTSRFGQQYQCSYLDQAQAQNMREREEEKIAMETGIVDLLRPMEGGACLTLVGFSFNSAMGYYICLCIMIKFCTNNKILFILMNCIFHSLSMENIIQRLTFVEVNMLY